MRIGFAGTPPFAATALKQLLDASFDVVQVWTQPDRPAGRGQQLQPSAVKQLALAQGLPVLQPQGLKLDGRFADEAQQTQRALLDARVDAMVVVAYGLIVPDWVLHAPRLGCLNIHGSLLPRWRGAAPIQRAIEAGDAQTGITIIRMDAGLDTGDMLLREAITLGPEDTSQTVHDRLAVVGAQAVVRALRAGEAGAWHAVPQPLEGVCYAHKIDKAEAVLAWDQPAATLERRLRAFDPNPGCTFEWQGARHKLWRGRVAPSLPGVEAAPGTVTVSEGRMTVRCLDADLEVLEIQRPGAKRMAIGPFLQGLA